MNKKPTNLIIEISRGCGSIIVLAFAYDDIRQAFECIMNFNSNYVKDDSETVKYKILEGVI